MRNSVTFRAVLAVLAAGLLLAALPAPAAAQNGPYQYHSLTPCRLADTRNPAGPSGGPILTGQVTRTFPVQNLCGVPIGAAAVSVNVTAVGPTGGGYLTLFPTGVTKPLVSSINYAKNEPALGNGAIVPLGTYSATAPYDLSIYASVNPVAGVTTPTVHMVLDVTGYFQ
jgi:hypothetical protein